MIIKPDIELDEEVCIPYTDEIEQWVEENLPGLKSLTVFLFVRRDRYNQVGSIQFVEKEQKIRPLDKPKHEGRELKVKEICDLLMKLIQADYDQNDKLGKYKFQAKRIVNGGERTFSKHFSPPPMGTDQVGGFINNPSENEEQETIPLLRGMVSEMFDRYVELTSSMSGLFTTMAKQNKDLQESLARQQERSVEIARMQMTREMWSEDKLYEKELAKIKAKASADKTAAVMQQLAKSGALKAVGDSLVPALMSRFGMAPSPQQLPQAQNNQGQEIVPNPPPIQIRPKTAEEEQAELEKGMREAPLKTMCNLLGNTLEDNEKEFLQEELEEVWPDLNKAMNAETETEARESIKALTEKVPKMENPMKLMKALDKLDDQQKVIINSIMNFKM